MIGYFILNGILSILVGVFYSKWRRVKKQNDTLSSANVEWSNSLIQTQKEKESYKMNFELAHKLIHDLNVQTLNSSSEHRKMKRDNEMLFEHNVSLRDKVREKIFQLRVLKGVNDKMISDAFFKPLFERRYQNQIEKQKKAFQKIELIARDGFWDDKSIDKDCNRIIKIAQEAQGVVIHKGGSHPAPKNVTVQVAKKKPVLKKKRITKK